MLRAMSLLVLTLAAATAAAQAPARTASPPDAEVYIISPQNGATVGSTFTVRFGLRGMGIAPAGIHVANTGHHHLLIDTDPPPFDQPIPADAQHVHFGKGQTETTITLPPGRHTLRLLLGDHNHIPHQPPVLSAPITVTVEAGR